VHRAVETYTTVELLSQTLLPDIVQFIEDTRGVIKDVDAVIAAVEPGRRQAIWKTLDEHTTNG